MSNEQIIHAAQEMAKKASGGFVATKIEAVVSAGINGRTVDFGRGCTATVSADGMTVTLTGPAGNRKQEVTPELADKLLIQAAANAGMVRS